MNGETYQVLSGGSLDPTGNAFDPVTSHVTSFRSTTVSSHLIYAQVVSQLASPVVNASTVSIVLSSTIQAGIFPQTVPTNIMTVVPVASPIDTNQASPIASFKVERAAEPSATPITVTYSLSGNAVAGTDFIAPTGSITLTGAQTSKTVDITIPAGNVTPRPSTTLEFNFENGNYFSYITNGLITLNNSLNVEPPTTNLIVHYDATSIASSGSAVTGWTDLSGHTISATQVTGANQPTKSTGTGPVKSSSSTVVMDGASDYLTIPSNASINSSGSYTSKVVTVAFVTGSDVSRTQILFAQGTSSNGLNIYIRGGSIYANGYSSTNTWGPVFVSSAVTANTYYVYTLAMSASAGTIKGYLSGALAGSASGVASTGFPSGGSGNALGGSTGSTKLDNGTTAANMTSATCFNSAPCLFGGTLLEFYYYNGTLTDTQILGHHNYLINKETVPTASIVSTGLAPKTDISNTEPKVFQVQLSAPAVSATTVNYTVDAASTGVAGTDFTALPGSIVIPAGYSSAYIPVSFLHNAVAASKTLKLNLASGSNYYVDPSANTSTIIIYSTDQYTPPNLLAWWMVPSNLTLTGMNTLTSWGDKGTSALCTHPLLAQPAGTGVPAFNTSDQSLHFDGSSLIAVNSNGCIDNVAGGITTESIVIVFKTGSDVTTDQILYKQGSSTAGISLNLSNGTINYTSYSPSWNQHGISYAISPNTLYAYIWEFSSTAVDHSLVGVGLGTGSVSWNLGTAPTANNGGAIAATSNNGISIGGVQNGVKYYSGNTNAYGTVPDTTSNVMLMPSDSRVYEVLIMNNTIYSSGGTNLTNLENYLAGKYAL